MNYDNILTILKENGYKATPQRKAIIVTLLKFSNSLSSADQLYSATKEMYEKTNRSTIYRNLEILETLNLIYKITNNGLTLYKLSCSHEGHHHHLICKECGKTEAIDFCPIDIFERLSSEKQFNLTDHKLELYGHCKNCIESSRQKH